MKPDEARANPRHQEEPPSAGGRACAATRRDGQPCRAPAVHARADSSAPEGRRWTCQAHRPDRDPAAARAASAKGGHNRANARRALKAAPESLQGLLTALYAAVIETREGAISPSQATAISNLSASIVRAVEVVELTDRLERLEARLAPNRPAHAQRPALPARPERQFAPAHAIAAAERDDWGA